MQTPKQIESAAKVREVTVRRLTAEAVLEKTKAEITEHKRIGNKMC